MSTILPIPIYTRLSSCYISKLPSSITQIDDRLVGCFCWNCCPRLYESLANHPLMPTTRHEFDHIAGRPMKSRPKYTIVQIVDWLNDRLSAQRHAGLTDRERKCQREAQSLLNRFRSSRRSMPDLDVLAEPLNQMFFAGLLTGYKYKWKELEPDRKVYGYTTEHKHEIVLNYELQEQDGGSFGGTRRWRGEEIFATMLHEMIHAFIGIYLCQGSCGHGSDRAQRKLCFVVTERMYRMYRHVYYNGHKVKAKLYDGHGPAFQNIARHIQMASNMFFELDAPMNMTFVRCRCGGSSCLSHCFDKAEKAELERIGRECYRKGL
ncbi:hypothetical protein BDV95DRAFT_592365 [Massariosphaeria phaeospora]|uniref:SprT-like domain-containing protein n=1 Tax=Massariosphaeria phaeospora TaxID=100035 RepID=A0A7C8MCF6_9PLEO|nr:hypothetical protein BDV95DRAFT_592365 [Massariosphaeria phaeospora]